MAATIRRSRRVPGRSGDRCDGDATVAAAAPASRSQRKRPGDRSDRDATVVGGALASRPAIRAGCSPDPGDREDPPEREPGGAVGLRRVRRPQPRGQLRPERGVRRPRPGRRAPGAGPSSRSIPAPGPGPSAGAGRWSPRRRPRRRWRRAAPRTPPARRRHPHRAAAGPAARRARGPGRATGAPKLPGTCIASSAPAASAATHRGSSSRCCGTHCSTALLITTSVSGRGVQPATSARRASIPRTRAASTISAELSRASTSAAGQRAASSVVRLPGPQPEVDDPARTARR